jgi:hypothetical protein
MQYYIAKVKFVTTDDNGKVKKSGREYLVEAVSIGDAEVIVHKNLTSLAPEDFEISAIIESKIADIFTKDVKANEEDLYK